MRLVYCVPFLGTYVPKTGTPSPIANGTELAGEPICVGKLTALAFGCAIKQPKRSKIFSRAAALFLSRTIGRLKGRLPADSGARLR